MCIRDRYRGEGKWKLYRDGWQTVGNSSSWYEIQEFEVKEAENA